MADTGTLRSGRFVVLQPIGEGAQGRTFDGVDKVAPHGGEGAVARYMARIAEDGHDAGAVDEEAGPSPGDEMPRPIPR